MAFTTAGLERHVLICSVRLVLGPVFCQGGVYCKTTAGLEMPSCARRPRSLSKKFAVESQE